MSAWAYTQATGCGSGTCADCQPDASGTCVEPGALTVGGTRIEGTATWQGQATLEIDLH